RAAPAAVAQSSRANASVAKRRMAVNTMALPAVENYTTTTPDGVEIRLARYRGGSKGPVMVVHGAGVWSGMFLLPTVDENFTQYLVKNGYDGWLLDWRASVQLPV